MSIWKEQSLFRWLWICSFYQLRCLSMASVKHFARLCVWLDLWDCSFDNNSHWYSCALALEQKLLYLRIRGPAEGWQKYLINKIQALTEIVIMFCLSFSNAIVAIYIWKCCTNNARDHLTYFIQPAVICHSRFNIPEYSVWLLVPVFISPISCMFGK
jgi:hypothetical protein